MSQDPYHVVQQEIQASLQTAENLRASYLRIRSTARGETEELQWARNELKATLVALEADLEDLEESVKIVERTGPAIFGIEERELMERQKYVTSTRKSLQTMREEVPLNKPAGAANEPLNRHEETEDDQAEWARQEQQIMIRQQDRALDSISGTLTNLAQQAGLIGQEVGEHNEILHDLEAQVDRTESKLAAATRRMECFLRKAEESRWSIYILIAVLSILLLLVLIL